MSGFKRFFKINWGWLMTLTIVDSSLSGTRFMQGN